MASARLMQRLGLQTRVPAEHLPVFVAGDEGDLLDGKNGFEESACALVPEIMKVKVVDVERAALASGKLYPPIVRVGSNS